MPRGQLHLLKLCVGAEAVADLKAWQARLGRMQKARGEPVRHVHVTRMWPRREAELLDGGSLYWVFKGYILARQRIEALERVTGADGTQRCAIVLSYDVVEVEPSPRRPFQGWRYLAAKDAPADLDTGRSDGLSDMPAGLRSALSDLGVR
ncbi:MAG: DUF1489 family protein [Rubricella sp.]